MRQQSLSLQLRLLLERNRSAITSADVDRLIRGAEGARVRALGVGGGAGIELLAAQRPGGRGPTRRGTSAASGSPSVPRGRFASSVAGDRQLAVERRCRRRAAAACRRRGARTGRTPSSAICVARTSRWSSSAAARCTWSSVDGGRAAPGRAAPRPRSRTAAAAASAAGPRPSRGPSGRSGSATCRSGRSPAGCSATTVMRSSCGKARSTCDGAHERQARDGVGHGLRVDGEQAPGAGGGRGRARIARGALPVAPTTVTRSIENTGDERRIE